MGTMHVINTDPAPAADTARQCEPEREPDAPGDSRTDAMIDDHDEMPEESGYGYGV